MNNLILKYYENIDKNILNEIFDESCIYKRGEITLQGLEEIKNFYKKDRNIKNGNHTIYTIENRINKIIVNGSFKGYKNDIFIEVIFEDIFVFNIKKLIIERTTSFLNDINI